jgi:hypothetical protein
VAEGFKALRPRQVVIVGKFLLANSFARFTKRGVPPGVPLEGRRCVGAAGALARYPGRPNNAWAGPGSRLPPRWKLRTFLYLDLPIQLFFLGHVPAWITAKTNPS